jgi:hypothetical protein
MEFLEWPLVQGRIVMRASFALWGLVALAFYVSPVAADEFQLLSAVELDAASRARDAEINALRASVARLEAERADGGAVDGWIAEGCDCECAADCVPSCCRLPRGWIGGAGAYVIKPHWNQNSAFTSFTGNTGGPTEFNYDYEATPLAWIGYMGDTGFGVRARWWMYDQGASVNVVNDGRAIQSATPGGLAVFSFLPGDRLSFTGNTDLDVWDLEAMQWVACGNWLIGGSAGVRYVHIAQHYNAFLLTPDFFGIGTFHDQVTSGHSFDGVGPTLSLEMRRAVGTCGLSLYGNARYSVLFGDNQLRAQQATAINNNVFFRQTQELSSWASRAIAELELGAEYAPCVGCGRAFIRAGLVGQLWNDVGNNSASLITVPAAGGEEGTNMGFFGLRVAVGFGF